MNKNESTFEEKIIKRLKRIEKDLSCLTECMSNVSTVDYSNDLYDVYKSIDNVDSSISEIYDILGGRYDNVFDGIGKNYEEIDKKLDDIINTLHAISINTTRCLVSLSKINNNLHDTIVCAIRDANDPNFKLPENEEDENNSSDE